MSNIGGMQRVATELIDELRRRSDLQLYEIVLRSSWSLTHVLVVPFLLATFVRLRRLVRGDRIDAVLFTSMVTATLTTLMRPMLRRHGVRSLVIVHGLDVTTPSAFWQRLVRRVFASVDLVLPVSNATAGECLRRGLDPANVCVIHNGVDTRRFPDLPPSDRAREELLAAFAGESDAPLLPEAAFLLASVGRLVRRKGFAWFIMHVMPRLPEHVHYWIAGEGPEVDAIREAIDRHGLAHRVRTWGKISESRLQALYRGADLFLMPNVAVPGDIEGFGIVMLEAGMNGLPTVAARIEGISEVIREGENGAFVESGDAQGFVEAIRRYEMNPTELASARLRVRRHVETTFGWETVADRYMAACCGDHEQLSDLT